jgi:exodeoxyribonuclease V beta subunit
MGLQNFSLNDFDTNKSLYIEASAGTGKTYTIQLMVAKMIAEGTPLKKILIVTYTEKAAGELKDRIRKKIVEVLTNNRIDEKSDSLSAEQIERFEQAYRDVDNASIFTIHSFCQKALKEYAYDANRPFDMGMIDDATVEDVVDKYIRDNWKDNEVFQKLLSKDGVEKYTDRIKKEFISAVKMYKGKDGDSEIVKPEVFVEWAGLAISEEDAKSLVNKCDFKSLDVFKEFKEKFNLLKEKYGERTYKASCVKTVNKEKTEVEDDFSVAALIKKLENWDSSQKNPFTGGQVGEKLIDLPEDEFGKTLNYVFEKSKKLDKLHDDISNFLEKGLVEKKFKNEQTRKLFDVWQSKKAEDKVQSFDDMILFVHKAIMSGDGSLKKHLRLQYKCAIIDEFQDTNQIQWDIFKTVFLTDNETNKTVEGHSVIVVGDPKQSIYSFQGADVNVYKKAVDEIKNGRRLTYNYRSTTGIIEGCNALFAGSFFEPADGMNKLIDFNNSDVPEEDKGKKAVPEIEGEPTCSIWVSENDVDEDQYAQMTVAQIIDWCTYVGEGENRKTKLQVFDKNNPQTLKNVTFSDFAILAHSRTEMDVFKSYLRQAGVPYSHYKEKNLFKSRECHEWIALLGALSVSDFSGWNRRYMSEALITDFFAVKLDQVESQYYDYPDNPERKKLNVWRSLALKFRYAEMLERIYEDTQIDVRLTDIAKLQELAKIRQIGNYIVDYLYNHRCSLEDMVRHLEGLARFAESTDDENGDLIEKGFDSDCVQIMTIHASKGLEFPVVISAAGFKGYYDGFGGPFLFHKDDDIFMGFGDLAKRSRKREELEEWKRLYYVDFTRASSILVLPRFRKWKDKDGFVKEEFKFLHAAITAFCSSDCEHAILNENETIKWDRKKLLVKTTEILKQNNKELEDVGKIAEVKAAQQNAMSALQKALPDKAILQYSYSTLAGRADSPIENVDGTNTDPDGSSDQDVPEHAKPKGIDDNVIVFSEGETLQPEDCHADHGEVAANYPRGSKVGNALHNTLEVLPFQEFGENYQDVGAAFNSPELRNIVEEKFKAESLPIEKKRDAWIKITMQYLWNTLNAKLPTIAGVEDGKAVIEKTDFKLTDLPSNAHKPEVRFDLNADKKDEASTDIENNIHRFCKGFIDLMFVREDSHKNKRYCILDWKSDRLEDDIYSPAALKKKVNEEYSVQRVLYSYCLIQWLKQFYNESESDIFKNHFGGIYYAFLRGAEGGTGKGIYAQTWKDYATLEAAYKNVKNLMSKSKKTQNGEEK